jgi:DNA-binding CsgD family transcriptional regulator
MVSDHVAGDGTLPPSAAVDTATLARLYWVLLYGAVLSTVPEHIIGALAYLESLSGREFAVFERLGHGCSNRDIAQRLTLSERTVKRHVSAVLSKLNVESRLQAGLVAQLTRLLAIKAPSDPKVVFTDSGVSDDTVTKASPPQQPAGRAADRPGTPPAAGRLAEGLVGRRVFMAFDALAALRAAGNPIDVLTNEQKQVFASLSEEEVAVLNSIKRRLDLLEDPEVEGHDLKVI